MISALLSYLLDVNELHEVEIARFIGIDFIFTTPKLQLFRPLFLDALAFALLLYSFNWYETNEIAKKQKYRVDERQETLSLVLIGLISSFFAGHPTGQSKNANKIGVNTDASSILVNLIIFLVLLPMTIWANVLFKFVPVVR